MKQRITQAVFQLGNLLADRALGDEQLIGRMGEALVARGHLEYRQGIQGQGFSGHVRHSMTEFFSFITCRLIVCVMADKAVE